MPRPTPRTSIPLPGPDMVTSELFYGKRRQGPSGWRSHRGCLVTPTGEGMLLQDLRGRVPTFCKPTQPTPTHRAAARPPEDQGENWTVAIIRYVKVRRTKTMSDAVIGLLSGAGSGVVVAVVNYYLTHRALVDRLRNESERSRRESKGALITAIVAAFEDVRINYERIRMGKPLDPRFEIRGPETISLTNIWRDLRVQRPLLTEMFYSLLMEQHDTAGALAHAINADQPTWQAAIARWEAVREKVSKAIEVEFYR